MASIVRRGEFYTAVFYVPNDDGKFVQRWRSTRQREKRKAMKVALELEAASRQECEVSSRECLKVVEKATQKAAQGLLTA